MHGHLWKFFSTPNFTALFLSTPPYHTLSANTVSKRQNSSVLFLHLIQLGRKPLKNTPHDSNTTIFRIKSFHSLILFTPQ